MRNGFEVFSRRKQTLSIDNAESRFTVSGPCVFTGKNYSVSGDLDGLIKWLSGELIQRSFPDMNADDREFIISGISPAGWDETFRSGTTTD